MVEIMRSARKGFLSTYLRKEGRMEQRNRLLLLFWPLFSRSSQVDRDYYIRVRRRLWRWIKNGMWRFHNDNNLILAATVMKFYNYNDITSSSLKKSLPWTKWHRIPLWPTSSAEFSSWLTTYSASRKHKCRHIQTKVIQVAPICNMSF